MFSGRHSAVLLAGSSRCVRGYPELAVEWVPEESTRTMKRNMVPLLGIAFVVAIISTGVFYGLFAGKLRSSSDLPGHAIVVAARDLDRGTVLQPADLRVAETLGVLSGAFSKPEDAVGATLLTAVRTNEPLLEERLTPRVSDAARAAGPVPNGMRAVTLHIFQSESVVNLLRPGSRVDLQAVSDRNGGAELRTVLENVEVLGVNSPDANGNRPNGAVVTVLIGATDADPVALADTGSRIRVALRNSMDEQTTPRHSLTLAALFSGKATADLREPGPAAGPTVWDHPLRLHIQALSVTDEALEELKAQAAEIAPEASSSSGHSWRAACFRSSEDAAKRIHKLEREQELEVISSERLMAGIGRPISYHEGSRPNQLRVQFSPQWLGPGKLVLEVQPRIGASEGTRTQLPPDSTSFLLAVGTNGVSQGLGPELFPGHSWEHRRLLILVSSRAIPQASTAAVARTDRGR